jgi:hypothetical protein
VRGVPAPRPTHAEEPLIDRSNDVV